MILLTSILAGGITGWGIARWQGRIWHPPGFRFLWLIFLGFLPQILAFYLPFTRQFFTNELASASLISSQVVLLVFALANLQMPGMAILLIGLGCNLAVIVSNGGFMPLSLEAVSHFIPQNILGNLVIGGRISSASKDILLPESQIILPWLADRFVSPDLPFYRFIFSLGDVLIAAGAFWMLTAGKSTSQVHTRSTT